MGRCMMPTKVMSLIAPYLIKKAINSDRRHDHFHPSAWGSCLRKVALEYYNEKYKFHARSVTDINIRSEMIFDNGHGVHARWQKYLDNANVLRGAWKCPNPACGAIYGDTTPCGIFNPSRTGEFKCRCGNMKELDYHEMVVISDKEYNFKGSVDAIVDIRGPFGQDKPATSNEIFVVDFKSCKSNIFEEIVHAKFEHVVQVHIYMWLLDLNMGVVLYECKDDQRVKEMPVPRDPSMIERIKKESKWLLSVLEANKMPPVPSGFTQSKIPCYFCEFANRCY
jgi:hypothetical protein